MIVKKFDNSLSRDWDGLIDKSNNGTFLLKRSFISYHMDRFHEASLIVENKDSVVALLPLSIHEGRVVISYGGLTYGGLIYSNELNLLEVLKAWELCIEFLKRQEWKSLIVKLVPNHYLKTLGDESIYFMFLQNAFIQRVDTAFVVDRLNLKAYQKRRRRSIKKAQNLGYDIRYNEGFTSYWNDILIPNLKAKHGVEPVHSLQEIELLKSRFQENIEQVNIYYNDEIVAGTTLFITPTTIHAQYISGSDIGKKGGFLDALFAELIENYKSDIRYFDFGIANEQEGRFLNVGLTDWKESFGSNTVAHIFYELQLA